MTTFRFCKTAIGALVVSATLGAGTIIVSTQVAPQLPSSVGTMNWLLSRSSPTRPARSSRTFFGIHRATGMALTASKRDNNKMQLTRSGRSRWRPSQLILVLDGP